MADKFEDKMIWHRRNRGNQLWIHRSLCHLILWEKSRERRTQNLFQKPVINIQNFRCYSSCVSCWCAIKIFTRVLGSCTINRKLCCHTKQLFTLIALIVPSSLTLIPKAISNFRINTFRWNVCRSPALTVFASLALQKVQYDQLHTIIVHYNILWVNLL